MEQFIESHYSPRVDPAEMGLEFDNRLCQLLSLDTDHLPMRKYCIYSGSNFELGSSLVSRMAGNRTMQPLEKSPDNHLEIYRAKLSFSQLAVVFNNVPTRLKLVNPVSYFTVAIPICGHLSMKTPSGEISTAPSQGLLVKIRDTPDIIRSKNSVVLVATLSEEHYQQLFGYCTDMLLNAAAGKLPVLLDLLDPKYRIFLSILGTLYRSLDEEQNAHLRQDVVIRCLEKALWNQFDDLVPNFEVETPVDQDYTLLPKHLRKAVDFIHEHADQELNMSCLEKVSGVSSRSLQAGFKDWLGIRPMHYVKKIRLSKVRADLLNATPQSAVIGDIAARWGFFHLSNFSKDFRNEFGELPSETLHRSRLERAM